MFLSTGGPCLRQAARRAHERTHAGYARKEGPGGQGGRGEGLIDIGLSSHVYRPACNLHLPQLKQVYKFKFDLQPGSLTDQVAGEHQPSRKHP